MSGYDGAGYEFAPVRNGKAIGMPLVAPRVTDITKVFSDIPPNALGYSGMSIAATATAKLAADGYDFSQADAEAIYAAMKSTGINPSTVWGAKRDLGTVAHDSIEYFLRHGEWPHVPSGAVGYVEAGKKWVADNLANAELLAIEEPLLSVDPLYCGTPDLIYREHSKDALDRCVVADWKTAKQCSLDYLLQLAFYGHAAMAHGICKTWPRLVVVLLLPSGKYREYHSTLTSANVRSAYQAWETVKQAKECVA